MASDLVGKGYGDTHEWKKLPFKEYTDWCDAVADYECVKCNRFFSHFYHTQSNIFKAMENANVGVCSPESKAWNTQQAKAFKELYAENANGNTPGTALRTRNGAVKTIRR